jgi:hypothetical protein
MKSTEFVPNMRCYQAVIQVRRGTVRATARTLIFAESSLQARVLLEAMYGQGSVASVAQIHEQRLGEVASPNNALVPAEPRVFPTAYRQRLIRNALVNKLKRDALQVNPTIDDIRAARDEFKTLQKRADFQHAEKMRLSALRQRRPK